MRKRQRNVSVTLRRRSLVSQLSQLTWWDAKKRFLIYITIPGCKLHLYPYYKYQVRFYCCQLHRMLSLFWIRFDCKLSHRPFDIGFANFIVISIVLPVSGYQYRHSLDSFESEQWRQPTTTIQRSRRLYVNSIFMHLIVHHVPYQLMVHPMKADRIIHRIVTEKGTAIMKYPPRQ